MPECLEKPTSDRLCACLHVICTVHFCYKEHVGTWSNCPTYPECIHVCICMCVCTFAYPYTQLRFIYVYNKYTIFSLAVTSKSVKPCTVCYTGECKHPSRFPHKSSSTKRDISNNNKCRKTIQKFLEWVGVHVSCTVTTDNQSIQASFLRGK